MVLIYRATDQCTLEDGGSIFHSEHWYQLKKQCGVMTQNIMNLHGANFRWIKPARAATIPTSSESTNFEYRPQPGLTEAACCALSHFLQVWYISRAVCCGLSQILQVWYLSRAVCCGLSQFFQVWYLSRAVCRGLSHFFQVWYLSRALCCGLSQFFQV